MGKERYIFTGIIIHSAYDFSFSTYLAYFYQHHCLWIQKSLSTYRTFCIVLLWTNRVVP